MDSLDYPAGYGWTYGFWTQRQEQDNIDFMLNLLLAFLMVYFVMASLFESLAHPFAIMFSLPFALVGGHLVSLPDRDSLQHHVPDRPHGAVGNRGEQRHRCSSLTSTTSGARGCRAPRRSGPVVESGSAPF